MEEKFEEHDFNFPTGVKVGVFIFLFAVAGITVWQMRSRLAINLPDFSTSDLASFAPSNILEQADEELRNQDSDEDGLSDYDELRVYGSSPYLADSDSDGITDDQEVAAGTDPNCPVGENCFETFQTTNSADNTNPLGTFVNDEIKEALNDPDRLRELLIEGGADPLLVNSLDDQTIQVLAQEALQDVTGPTQEKIEFLQDLEPSEIRSLLKSFGMSEEQLADLTDDELVEIYQQALEAQQ